uniref:Uncharacterized protein n=1 Tax=Arion vulgaris TaxID=1028688 RepID=A0A0B7BZK7_9EUPU
MCVCLLFSHNRHLSTLSDKNVHKESIDQSKTVSVSKDVVPERYLKQPYSLTCLSYR